MSKTSLTLSIFQMEVERVLKTISFQFLNNYYGECILYKYEYDEVVLHYKRGKTLSGIHITITPNSLDIYKTNKDDTIDNLRHMYGYYKNNSTVSTGKIICDTDEEYNLVNKYLVSPIYNTILNKIEHDRLVELIDDSEIKRVTKVRKSAYLTNQINKKKLYKYLIDLTTELVQDGTLKGTYYFSEIQYPYLSLNNYYYNVSSEFAITNETGEKLVLISYNDRLKGIKYLSSEDTEDDYLYELRNVLEEIKVGNNFMPIHHKIIKLNLLRYLEYYKEPVVKKKPTKRKVKKVPKGEKVGARKVTKDKNNKTIKRVKRSR